MVVGAEAGASDPPDPEITRNYQPRMTDLIRLFQIRVIRAYLRLTFWALSAS
jgi:hypothetical protein